MMTANAVKIAKRKMANAAKEKTPPLCQQVAFAA
ncbi:MAG: hypothetical protein ACI9XO_002235 [Paraglaciecola sp.]|jgi:hypothetical protein